ncbi:hypothetical protein ATX60_02620 [Oenococcus oeni]|nr:hypothetical protein ATX60_02620 [Oenococcus oeni]OLQ40853.1 hypothetical protein ATX28_02645 [Oenococcus oeni]
MNRYRLSVLIIEFIYQFPKIMMLNLCWAMASLPVLSVGTSTRALIASLIVLQKQQSPNFKSFQIFKDNFIFFFQSNWKRDLLGSFYFAVIVIDKIIFASQTNPESQILKYAAETILFLILMIYLYQTYLAMHYAKYINTMIAMYSMFKNPSKILLHYIFSLIFFYLLSFFGPVYLCLTGSSLFFFINLKLMRVFNKQNTKN